jgi:hypothetical protein
VPLLPKVNLPVEVTQIIPGNILSVTGKLYRVAMERRLMSTGQGALNKLAGQDLKLA